MSWYFFLFSEVFKRRLQRVISAVPLFANNDFHFDC